MNILIVGNGFDLSHYLPTKYDHFMDVMAAIEKKDTGGLPNNLENTKLEDWLEQIDKTLEYRKDIAPPAYEMNFDELFAKTRDPEFIDKTRDLYLTENIQICAKDVLKLQYRLEMNCWYQYFSAHVREVKTWIDFELKINEVLKVLAIFILQIERISNEQGLSSNEIFFKTDVPLGQIFLTIENCHILELLKITKSGYYAERELFDDESGNYYQMIEVDSDDGDANLKFYIESENVQFQHGSYKVKIDKIMLNLHKELENFVEIFNKYLELIITCLEPRRQFKTPLDYLTNPNKILSFNYTNTYKRHYGNVDVEYLHGSHGEKQNIVLGVSDLEEESLKKIKAYGFTKYHQKLFKDTDYLFLDNYKIRVKDSLAQLEKHKRTAYSNFQSEQRDLERINKLSQLNLNFSIWGHSLDVSDKDYIIDLFSLNDDMDRNVRVVIYHYDKPAKFSLLNNLLAILGKDKVEKWMKNKWLEFKPNPKVKFEVDSNFEEAS